jgi:hypothetical protein
MTPAADIMSNGTTTAKQTTLSLPSGWHYIKVVAYSTFGATNNTSQPSVETSVCVPFGP